MGARLPDHFTVCYKRIGEIELLFDFYPPSIEGDPSAPTPALVYFHAGGLTAGDRQTFVPSWLKGKRPVCPETTLTLNIPVTFNKNV